ncbi:MAG: NUDIX domain-containing protein [Cyclobacteriaceae bacterium]|jgi:8-oxo-dGTP pyrophosphatase MutT (NUDIX family)|nr:NUDIX domain-containing protein [Cyclobacteriaceae bacterium]
MIVFINDIPVIIYKADEAPTDAHFNQVIDAAAEPITRVKLIHHVWVKNVHEPEFGVLLEFLNSKVPLGILSLHITVYNYEAIKEYLRLKYKVIKAAGGLVRKKDKFLMIYRMKKWDLPKGKKEKKESFQQTALREIGEECSITVKLGPKICTTWHTYTMNRKAMLKKTKWYIMDILDDSAMHPSGEEDIEDIRWMSQKEVYHALEHSYRSIRHVFEKYYELMDVKSIR